MTVDNLNQTTADWDTLALTAHRDAQLGALRWQVPPCLGFRFHKCDYTNLVCFDLVKNTQIAVANLVSFHTSVTMAQALQLIHQEGHTVDRGALATFSPYWTGHINRFGNYTINKNRQPDPLEHHLQMPLPPIFG